MVSHLLRYLKQHHLALLALFLATGGVSYAAVHLPAHSVGTNQLKNRAVTKRKIATRTYKALRGYRGPRGVQGLPGAPGVSIGAVDGDAPAPPVKPNRLWQEHVAFKTPKSGGLFVFGHVDAATLTCVGTGSCSIDIGLYVDGRPVPHTDRVATADCTTTPCAIRVRQQDLFGVATGVAAGGHVVQLASKDRSGATMPAVVKRYGEVGALSIGG
jgi:hypothetical protein